jgi:DNA-binding transcriptional MerR regulator
LLAELAELSGLPVTTVRYYVQERILRPLEFRGTATRYQRRELLRLLGLQRLKLEGKSSLAEMSRKLDALGEAELEQWLATGPLPLPPAAAAALGIQCPTFALKGAPLVPASIQTQSSEILSSRSEIWQRITLLPGLELLLRADAKEAAQAAARQICEEYVVVI